MGLALEPDFTIDFPEVLKDPEAHIAKPLLIPPVAAAVHEKRKQGQQLSNYSKKQDSSTTLPVHPFVQWLMSLERMFCDLMLK